MVDAVNGRVRFVNEFGAIISICKDIISFFKTVLSVTLGDNLIEFFIV